MGKLGRFIFFIVLCALAAILFVMLMPGMAMEEDNRIFRVSVVINDINDEYWKNFRKGVDSAAVDYNVDVHFVTLMDGVSEELQERYIEREIKNDADAIVVSAVDGESLAHWLPNVPSTVPVISIGEEIPSGRVDVNIGSDSFAMGSKLAQDIKAKTCFNPCTVIIGKNNNGIVQKRLNGLKQGFEQLGVPYTVIEAMEESQIEGMEDMGILVALEESTLKKLLLNNHILYGIGFTNEILHAVDDGIILGLVVQSDYAAGYLSIKSAVNKLKGEFQSDKILLGYYSLDGKNMYERPMDQIIFPLS